MSMRPEDALGVVGGRREDFPSTGLRNLLLQNVAKSGYKVPTPVQQYTIPLVKDARRDVMAVSATGSGKSAAFLLPVLHRLLQAGY